MIDEDTKTLWCGNLSDQVTKEILYELFLQAGPLEKVMIPRDRDGRQKNFAFITYCHEVSVPYALNLIRGTALFNRTLNLQSKGRMVMLPPPVRCYGLEMPMNFQNQENVAQHFLEMTEKLKQDNPLMYNAHQPQDVYDANQHAADNLVMASLQGNWTHRHHPYRPKDKMHSRDSRHNDNSNDYRRGENRERENHSDYRYSDNKDRDDYKSRSSKYSNNWRDRRNNRSRR